MVGWASGPSVTRPLIQILHICLSDEPCKPIQKTVTFSLEGPSVKLMWCVWLQLLGLTIVTVQHQNLRFDPFGYMTGHWFTPSVASGWVIRANVPMSLTAWNGVNPKMWFSAEDRITAAHTADTRAPVLGSREGFEQQGDMAQSDTVYCAWNEQNSHMLLPGSSCRFFLCVVVLCTLLKKGREFVLSCKTWPVRCVIDTSDTS